MGKPSLQLASKRQEPLFFSPAIFQFFFFPSLLALGRVPFPSSKLEFSDLAIWCEKGPFLGNLLLGLPRA